MNVARRNLLQNPTRLSLSSAGVGLAVMLILLLNGLLTGMYRQISAYLDHTPGSVVVAQEGVSNLLGATSWLRPGSVDEIRQVQGVTRAIPVLSQFIILDLHGKKQPAYLVGYDPATGGGPWRVTAGREPQANDEIVFDRVLADRHGIKLNERFEVLGKDLTLVGLSEGTTSWMTSFLFVRKSAAEALFRAQGATSFVVVSGAAGLAPDALQKRLRTLSGTNVLPKDEMIANDERLFARAFSGPLRLMVGIAFLVGTLVVGLVIYTATVERQREYGTLKAIGARNGLLYKVVTTQALIAAGSGAVLGVGLAYAASRLIMTLRPQFLVTYEPAVVAGALLSGLGMALLAALFPARTVARLAPADVFRR